MEHVVIFLIIFLNGVRSVHWEHLHCATDPEQRVPEGKVPDIGRFSWFGLLQHTFYLGGKTRFAVTQGVLIHPSYVIASAEDVARIQPQAIVNNTKFILWRSASLKYSMDIDAYYLPPEYTGGVTLASLAVLHISEDHGEESSRGNNTLSPRRNNTKFILWRSASLKYSMDIDAYYLPPEYTGGVTLASLAVLHISEDHGEESSRGNNTLSPRRNNTKFILWRSASLKYSMDIDAYYLPPEYTDGVTLASLAVLHISEDHGEESSRGNNTLSPRRNNTKFILWRSASLKYSMDIDAYYLPPEYTDGVTLASLAVLHISEDHGEESSRGNNTLSPRRNNTKFILWRSASLKYSMDIDAYYLPPEYTDGVTLASLAVLHISEDHGEESSRGNNTLSPRRNNTKFILWRSASLKYSMDIDAYYLPPEYTDGVTLASLAVLHISEDHGEESSRGNNTLSPRRNNTKFILWRSASLKYSMDIDAYYLPPEYTDGVTLASLAVLHISEDHGEESSRGNNTLSPRRNNTKFILWRSASLKYSMDIDAYYLPPEYTDGVTLASLAVLHISEDHGEESSRGNNTLSPRRNNTKFILWRSASLKYSMDIDAYYLPPEYTGGVTLASLAVLHISEDHGEESSRGNNTLSPRRNNTKFILWRSASLKYSMDIDAYYLPPEYTDGVTLASLAVLHISEDHGEESSRGNNTLSPRRNNTKFILWRSASLKYSMDIDAYYLPPEYTDGVTLASLAVLHISEDHGEESSRGNNTLSPRRNNTKFILWRSASLKYSMDIDAYYLPPEYTDGVTLASLAVLHISEDHGEESSRGNNTLSPRRNNTKFILWRSASLKYSMDIDAYYLPPEYTDGVTLASLAVLHISEDHGEESSRGNNTLSPRRNNTKFILWRSASLKYSMDIDAYYLPPEYTDGVTLASLAVLHISEDHGEESSRGNNTLSPRRNNTKFILWRSASLKYSMDIDAYYLPPEYTDGVTLASLAVLHISEDHGEESSRGNNTLSPRRNNTKFILWRSASLKYSMDIDAYYLPPEYTDGVTLASLAVLHISEDHGEESSRGNNTLSPRRNNTKFILWRSASLKYSMDIDAYYLPPEYTDGVTLASLAVLHISGDHGEESSRAPVPPVCLPFSGAGVFDDLYAVKMSDETGEVEKEMYKMNHVESQECEEFYYKHKLNHKVMSPVNPLCAAAANLPAPCVWDSGVALISRQSWGFWKLIGFSVRGPGCGAPTRFLYLHDYLVWIDEVVSRAPASLREQDPAIIFRRVSPIELVMYSAKVRQPKETGQCERGKRGSIMYKDSAELTVSKNFAQGFFFVSVAQVAQVNCAVLVMEVNARTNAAVWVEHHCHGDLKGHYRAKKFRDHSQMDCFVYFKSVAYVEFRFYFSFKAVIEISLYGHEEVPRFIPNPYKSTQTTHSWWPTDTKLHRCYFMPVYAWWWYM